jgi:hypothetical protein
MGSHQAIDDELAAVPTERPFYISKAATVKGDR